jgi:Leucine-rich repeat (LRR) protein
MGDRAMRWLAAGMVAAFVCAASVKAEEVAQPRALNSKVAFNVYAVIDGEHKLVGSTPSQQPLTVPPCERWYVVPRAPVDMEVVCREVQAQGIPGIQFPDAKDADIAHLKGLTGLKSLDLGTSQVTDTGLGQMTALTGLQTLDLGGTRVTDSGLQHLTVLTELQELDLQRTRVTDVGLSHLRNMKALRELNLASTRTRDVGIVYLKGLTALRRLDLQFTDIGDAGLGYLKELKALRYLDLGWDRVTDAGVEDIAGLAS